jgi:hypothetical protein
MPPEDRIRSHDRSRLLKHLPPEDLAFDGQPLSLIIVKQDSFLPGLLPQYPVLRAFSGVA